MVAGPEKDALDGNPIQFMTKEYIQEFYSKNMYSFNIDISQLIIKDEQEIVEEDFQSMSEQFFLAGREVRRAMAQGEEGEWDQHTDMIHDYFRNSHILQNYYICKNKAFLKMQEIFDMFPVKPKLGAFRSFHLCEGPGYFIEATYLNCLKHGVCSTGEWFWGANTLNPYFENIHCCQKLVDDSHIKNHMNNWFFGIKNDGDVRNLTEEYLIINELAGTFDMVTADGSTYTEGMEDNLERTVHPIIEGEIRVALRLLRTGGRLVLKVYRFNHRETREVIQTLGENFARIWAFKPMASRPGSSEKYLICDGFGEGTCTMRQALLVDCDEKFLANQMSRMRHHIQTFVDESRVPYKKEQRDQFIREMRARTFTSESADLRQKCVDMFPRDKPSPWAKLYGHNLVRRCFTNVENAIEDYLNSATLFNDTDIEVDWEEVCEQLQDMSNFETSDISLKVNDSLFIEPLALTALNKHHAHEAFDLFELTYRVRHDPENLWRNYCVEMPTEENKRRMVLTMQPFINLESIIDALLLGDEQKMDSFEFRAVDSESHKCPLILSRLSASVFILCHMFFELCHIEKCNVIFSQPRNNTYGREIAGLLREQLARFKNGTGIRTFVPLKLLEQFHGIITHINLCVLSSLKMIKVEPNE